MAAVRLTIKNKTRNWLPTESLPFSAGIIESGPHSIFNQFALKLGHTADDMKHEPSLGFRKVEIVPKTI